MKTNVACLVLGFIFTANSCMAQQRITVEAQSTDISNNLDLKAVASMFGDSRDLEEFEMRLNDYDNQLSNLDLNNDGRVDYLRVIETSEDNVHLVVIQAVLERDVFQDVATIVVERNQYNRTVVHVIGDPYMYGDSYIIEPIYYRSPSIFSYFARNSYRNWYSPYYWGYYPRVYQYRRPFSVNIYLSTIHRHINTSYDYRYRDYRYNERSVKLYNSIRRNDYGNRYPDRNFSNRNIQYKSKKDFDVKHSNYDRTHTESDRRNDYNRKSSNGNSTSRTNYPIDSRSKSTTVPTNRNNSQNSRNAESVRRPIENSNSRVSQPSRNSEIKRESPSVNKDNNSRINRENDSRRSTPTVTKTPVPQKSESTETKSSRSSNSTNRSSERR